MNLEKLFESLEYEVLSGTPDKDVKSIATHSEKASAGSAFFAIRGAEHDGRDYINKAIEKGAEVIVFDDPEGARPLPSGSGAALVRVPDARRALAAASANFFGRPQGRLLLIGVTGTKGKTTTAFMIREIFEKAGIKTGIIGTVMNGCEGYFEEAEGTTPDAYEIHRLLRMMADHGCKAVVMEVSSQGLMQQRVSGLEFDASVFTNIFPDHIGGNEHKNFEEYIYWKTMLFKQTKVAIINKDDTHWQTFAEAAEAVDRIITFGTDDTACGPVTYRAADISLMYENRIPGSRFSLDGQNFICAMPGVFNISNALGAAAAARHFGISWEHIREALETIKVRGRTEIVPFSSEFTVMTDYAHNGAALANLLQTLRLYKPSRLIAVFGCGGERDRNRRIEMAHAASVYADFSVITSDNPRSESPEKIISDITSAMDDVGEKYTVIPDRSRAVRWAVSQGQPGDIIVVAGKGHETYQIIGNVKKHFDDREVILSLKNDNRG